MKEVCCYSDLVEGTCGLTVLFNFESYDDGDLWMDKVSKLEYNEGAGFAVAGFIDTEECRDAYAALSLRFKIVYQSPVRMNTNSNNEFFFCIYDTSEESK